MLSMSEAAAATSIEDAVVAQIDLKKIMRNLHPEDCEILILRFMAGWTWVEIAAMKGQNTHALRKRCARAAEQLRRKFGAYSSRSRITEICEVFSVFLSRKPSAY
jgi:DNA-directed RNA polymerase specialized sigma24 family protein